jgi:hypothetical protein
MSEKRELIELNTGEHIEVQYSFEPDAETIQKILGHIDATPLELPTPLGDVEILENKRKALEDLMRKQKLSAVLTVSFQHNGEKNASGKILLGSSRLTGIHQLNLMAFGYGVQISIRGEIQTLAQTTQNHPGAESRHNRLFIIRWLLEESSSPGSTQTHVLKQVEQSVSGPGFEPVATHSPNEKSEKSGGGWLG